MNYCHCKTKTIFVFFKCETCVSKFIRSNASPFPSNEGSTNCKFEKSETSKLAAPYKTCCSYLFAVPKGQTSFAEVGCFREQTIEKLLQRTRNRPFFVFGAFSGSMHFGKISTALSGNSMPSRKSQRLLSVQPKNKY